jgi:hypothetical protein
MHTIVATLTAADTKNRTPQVVGKEERWVGVAKVWGPLSAKYLDF